MPQVETGDLIQHNAAYAEEKRSYLIKCYWRTISVFGAIDLSNVSSRLG